MTVPVAPFEDVSGEALRIVAELNNVSYEIQYVRDDLEDEYGSADLDRAYRSVISFPDSGRIRPASVL